MRAFHVNWTRPFAARFPDTPYGIEPFELLTTMLSALSWRAACGSIALFTDECGAAYYRALGLEFLWDDGIRPLPAIPSSVDPQVFWAAGKLYALHAMDAPCVMLDTDFIVWRNIAPLCAQTEVSVIHFEPLDPAIYPDRRALHASPPFDLDALDWTVPACNTALAYFGDAALKADYTLHAQAFMEHAPEARDPLIYMVFAEQRLLAMRCAAHGTKLTAFSDLPALFSRKQTYFTHIWGYKQQLRSDPHLYDDFCRRCAARLMHDHPAESARAARIPLLTPYFQTT